MGKTDTHRYVLIEDKGIRTRVASGVFGIGISAVRLYNSASPAVDRLAMQMSALAQARFSNGPTHGPITVAV